MFLWKLDGKVLFYFCLLTMCLILKHNIYTFNKIINMTKTIGNDGNNKYGKI